MANTRQSAKRARQTIKKQERNTKVKSQTRTAIKGALEAIQKKDATLVKDAYTKAIKALSKAASKGVIPKTRASRKISRLTLFVRKHIPEGLPFSQK